MRRVPRTALLLVALVAIAPVFAGCSNFDPDSMDLFGWNAKKPLPGKRELLFPKGVPGVTQGIPPEYRAGYQAPGLNDLPPGDSDATPGAAQTAKSVPVQPVRQSSLSKPKATAKKKAKPRRHVVKRTTAKPKPKAAETAAKPKGTAAPWPSTTRQQKQTASQPKGTRAPWPSQSSQSSRQTQAGWPGGKQKDQKLAPWPSAPPAGTFSK